MFFVARSLISLLRSLYALPSLCGLDLLEPIRIVRQELHKRVGLLNPHPNPSRAMLSHIDFIKQIRTGVLRASQFPATLTDTRGMFTKPAAW
jgi:hypothetical protein